MKTSTTRRATQSCRLLAKFSFTRMLQELEKKPARQPDHERPEKAQKRPEAHKKWQEDQRPGKGTEKPEAQKRLRRGSEAQNKAQKLGIGPGTHKRKGREEARGFRKGPEEARGTENVGKRSRSLEKGKAPRPRKGWEAHKRPNRSEEKARREKAGKRSGSLEGLREEAQPTKVREPEKAGKRSGRLEKAQKPRPRRDPEAQKRLGKGLEA